MKTHVTNQDKTSNRAEAQRRAILWSECELCKKQLERTQERVETISLSDTSESHTTALSELTILTL